MKPEKVAIYGRVSTLDKGQDVELQLSDLRTYADARGWKIFKEYLDVGQSGSMLHGCPLGEARALRCKDVNLRDSSITFSATFSNGIYREKRKGRGAKSYEIPIHPEMLEFISERVKSNLPEAYVFINPCTGNKDKIIAALRS